MKVLEIKDLDKYYNISKEEKFHSLKNVNITFNSGELVSIKGESGSGKSTLMNIIGGLDLDFTGSIVIEGNKDVKDFKEKELDEFRKNKIGFIFQSFNLIPHLTILDNVTIAMTLSNVNKKERANRAIELLEMLGIKKQMHKKPNQLSGGQKQRVAIARALINDPDIILADEPTGALDSETTVQILDILKDIAKQGKLVIMVTHSDKVADNSSRVIEIADGQVIADKQLLENKIEVNKEKSTAIKKEKQNLTLFSALKLSLTNMKEKKFRNILVSLGASIGIFSVVLMFSLGHGVKNFINEQITSVSNGNEVNISKVEVKSVTATVEEPKDKRFTNTDLETIKNFKSVDYIKKSIAFSMNAVAGYNGKTIAFQQLEVSDQLKDNEDYLIGKQPKEKEIAISDAMAKQLVGDKEEIKNAIGKELTLYVNDKDNNGKPLIIEEKLKVSGIYEMKKLYKSKLMQSMVGELTYGVINFDYFKDVYKNNNLELNIESITVYANDIRNIDAIKAEVKNKGYYLADAENTTADLIKYLNIATSVLAGIAAISLLVSAIMILIVLYISVVERTREIGVMRAIGARRKDIKRIFFAESALIGLFAGILGVSFAYLIGQVANLVSKQNFDAAIIDTNMTNILFGIALSVVISVVSGLMPAAKAAKLDPIESLRHE